MSLGQIIEGWKNHLLPEEKEKAFIQHVSQERLAICTLSAKTKCLTCECPLKKWEAQSLPDELTT